MSRCVGVGGNVMWCYHLVLSRADNVDADRAVNVELDGM